ncbi:hypothetical protein AWW66_30315 [Micromonospora rosaria]|uniref:Fibronectin type-III domain-containing protein n=1 Tax=Micromonospora rosaria TaxID=47874 RepID=A0A136PIV9_9ACTN|nr:fibronectin type III domain-containing protein [Micromonospora rosaria]KXK58340.1 hypothetical protein AWW66_30315 [Micromonospora rosaria]
MPTYPGYSQVPEEGESRRGRALVAVAVAGAVVAVAAVVGVGVVLLNREATPGPAGGSAPTAAGPATSGPPPGDLELRDDATTITITWSDPTNGTVPFMVAGGRAGQDLGVMATVDPGETSYTVNGLNSRVDYCFTVLAVYSTDEFATSGQVCTNRDRSTPST